MPELPEVHTVAKSLEPLLVGRTVRHVKVQRRDIVTGKASQNALLANQTVDRILRHGKQLAIVSDAGKCVCVHLGMSGSVLANPAETTTHAHIVWHMTNDDRIVYRDPRRFGGLWTYDTLEQLQADRWDKLGPDALTVQTDQLWQKFRATRRAIKAILLDQHVVAGLGNIYVDELLFRSRIHPMRPADSLRRAVCEQMIEHMQSVLQEAINARGSTLRDYVDSRGQDGGFQLSHQVYGRAGEPCVNCGKRLSSSLVGGRTTVWCGKCQRQRRLINRSRYK